MEIPEIRLNKLIQQPLLYLEAKTKMESSSKKAKTEQGYVRSIIVPSSLSVPPSALVVASLATFGDLAAP